MSNYTKANLKTDVKDSAKDHGVDTHAMHAASETLNMTEGGLSYQKTEPNQKSPAKHYHTEQEEVYVILAGGGNIILDNERIEIGPLDAVRVAKEVHRHLEAGPDGLEFIVFGSPRTGNDKGVVLPD